MKNILLKSAEFILNHAIKNVPFATILRLQNNLNTSDNDDNNKYYSGLLSVPSVSNFF